MSQPEDEETKEHPAYQPSAAAQPPGQPDAPMGTTSATSPGSTPASPTPAGSQSWQQPAPTNWQQPAAPQNQQPPSQGWQQPTGQGWQQPTPGGWQQQPPQQWQQPPGPPYGAPAGWAAGQQPWEAGPRYATSALVAVAGLLLVLYGLVDAVGGVWLLGQGSELSRLIQRSSVSFFGPPIDRETMRAVLSPMPAVLVVFGAIEILSGAGIFAHKGWARAVGILVALLGVVIGVVSVSFSLALAPGMSVALVGAVAVLLGYAFVLVALIAGGRHFRDRYAVGAPIPR